MSINVRTVRSHVQCASAKTTTPRSSASLSSRIKTSSPGQHSAKSFSTSTTTTRTPLPPSTTSPVCIHRKLPSRSKCTKETLNKSITAVNCIKNRCGDDVEKYRRFLTMVEGYWTGTSTKEQVYEEIYDMFDAGSDAKADVDMAKKINALFRLAKPSYVYLPKKHRDPIIEREDLLGLEKFEDPKNPPKFKFKLSDVLHNNIVLSP